MPRKAVSAASSRQQATIPPIGLPIKPAALFLGVAERQLRSLKYAKEVFVVRLGKRDVFTVKSLQEFLDKKAREAAA